VFNADRTRSRGHVRTHSCDGGTCARARRLSIASGVRRRIIRKVRGAERKSPALYNKTSASSATRPTELAARAGLRRSGRRAERRAGDPRASLAAPPVPPRAASTTSRRPLGRAAGRRKRLRRGGHRAARSLGARTRDSPRRIPRDAGLYRLAAADDRLRRGDRWAARHLRRLDAALVLSPSREELSIISLVACAPDSSRSSRADARGRTCVGRRYSHTIDPRRAPRR
jgi:hypothetical protein